MRRDTLQRDQASEIDDLIVRSIADQNAPGVAIAVTQSGETTFARGHGVLNVDSQAPVSSETLFHLASVTKLFVSTALMQLTESEHLDLDTAVVVYLPYFRLAGSVSAEMTVAQMMSHTSGMPDTDDYGWDHPEYDDGALERYVHSLDTLRPIGTPGEQYSYSNIAYEVLGDVIAKVSGVSFEEYVRREILLPLGMTHSTLLVRDADAGLLARPHVRSKGDEVVLSTVFPYNRAHAPSSTLYSSVLELSRFACAHLQRGTLDGARILSPGAYEAMWTPLVDTGDRYWPQMGLGWFLGERSSQWCVAHEGSDVGFKSCFILVPRCDVSVVGLSNLDGMKIEDLVDSILDVVLSSNAT